MIFDHHDWTRHFDLDAGLHGWSIYQFLSQQPVLQLSLDFLPLFFFLKEKVKNKFGFKAFKSQNGIPLHADTSYLGRGKERFKSSS